jgi:hypothetical protein
MNTVRRHPALFLDRDGVINVEKNFLYRIEDFEFVPGIFELCAVASELGLRPVVITNQAGNRECWRELFDRSLKPDEAKGSTPSIGCAAFPRRDRAARSKKVGTPAPGILPRGSRRARIRLGGGCGPARSRHRRVFARIASRR